MKAFPRADGRFNSSRPDELGMDLRDYFAAQAMATAYPTLYDMFLEDVFDDWHGEGVEALAREAYLIADAMMKERERTNG